MAAQAIALIELAQAGAFPGRVRFLATAGEEFGTPGANRLAAQGQATDLAALLVGEGTSGNVVYAHAGSINYRLTSQGKAAHSSTPERGVNALAPLVSFFAKVNPDLPVVVLGPDAWECSHQVNEWTTISSYLAVIEAYKTLITNFANA